MNRAASLELAIKSFCQQNCPVDWYEILVVDNGSFDNTKDITESAISAYPLHQIRYLYEPEPGLLSGRHRGALEAKSEILTFVDDDIEADANWLKAIKESFNDLTVHLVGGRNLPKYEVEPPNWLEWFWSDHPFGKTCSYLSLLDFGDQVREIDAGYIWGLNFSIRRSTLFELGGFHPDCIPKHLQHLQGDGETGVTQFATSKGYKAIYQPAALVYHSVPKERMTVGYFEKRCFYQGVCDSYTMIRKAEGELLISVVDRIKAPLRALKKRLERGVIRQQTEKEMLQERFHKAFSQGYQFHQNAVRQCPELLDWVLKSDYWDYKLPQLKTHHD